ncbi:aldo/keto reductase [Saccharothrix stipae]
MERIDLYRLHRLDPTVPLADEIGALRQLQDEGQVHHIGLSEVTVEQLREAQEIAPIVSVRNRYNLSDRRSEDVLEYCEQHGIAFIPWLPIKPSVHEANSPIGSKPPRFSSRWPGCCTARR